MLEKIIEIERHFQISISIPKEILHNDHEIIDYIFSIIHTGSFSGHWNSFNTKFEVDKDFKKKVEEMEDIVYMYQYFYTAEVELFGKNFSFEVKRELNSVRFEDLEHVKRKVREADIGDIIAINYIPDPAKENIFTDCFAKKVKPEDCN